MNLATANAAVLLWDGFQELEFWYPVLRLREAGARVTVVGMDDDRTYYSRLRYPVIPDTTAAQAVSSAFDLLFLPGTVNASALSDPALRELVQQTHARGGTVCASGAASTTLAQAGLCTHKSAVGVAHPAGSDDRVILAATADDLPALFVALQTRAAAVPA